jgi:ankyrin repeat protein
MAGHWDLDYVHPGCLRRVAKFGRADLCIELLEAQPSLTTTANGRHVDPAYIDALDHSGETALYNTIKWSEDDDVVSYLDTVSVLVQYGADVSAASLDGPTPLHAAIIFDCSIEFLNILLKNRPRDLNPKFKGETPLLVAVAKSFYDVGGEVPHRYKEQVDALLRHGADAHTVDNLGNSVLHHKYLNDWLLQKFLAYGVNIDRPGNGGRTPLHEAVYRGRQPPPRLYDTNIRYAANVAMFLDRGADIDIKDNNGRTAEDLALYYHGEDHPVYELLRDARILRDESRFAFASASHPKSGVKGYLGELHPDMYRMILDPRHFQRR